MGSRIGSLLSLLLIPSLFLFACEKQTEEKTATQTIQKEEGTKMVLTLTSTAFEHGGQIPVQYTCDGADISPPLKWSNPPAGTKSLVLICDDPDAPMGTWVHWVLYGIPPTTHELPEGLPKEKVVLGSARQGLNDFGRIGYGGPCPPAGKPHRYFFRLYAVDIPTDFESGLTKQDILDKISDHVLAEGELMGTYKR